VGQGRLRILIIARPQKIGRSPKVSGQKGRGSGGRNFCPLAEAKPRRPARQEQNPAKKFSFPFRRKNRARAN